jgi:hypothetical protein
MGQTDWCTCPDYAIDPACPKHGRTPEIANADAEEELTYATITPTPADLAADGITVTDETHVFTLGELADAVMSGRPPEGFTGTVTTSGDVIFIQAGDGQTVIVDSADVFDPAAVTLPLPGGPVSLGALQLQRNMGVEEDADLDKEVTLTLTVEDALTLHATINEKVDALSAAIVARQLTTEEAVTATTRLKRCLIAFNDALVAVIGGRTGTELQDACMALSDAERERLMEESIMRGMAQR